MIQGESKIGMEFCNTLFFKCQFLGSSNLYFIRFKYPDHLEARNEIKILNSEFAKLLKKSTKPGEGGTKKIVKKTSHNTLT